VVSELGPRICPFQCVKLCACQPGWLLQLNGTRRVTIAHLPRRVAVCDLCGVVSACVTLIQERTLLNLQGIRRFDRFARFQSLDWNASGTAFGIENRFPKTNSGFTSYLKDEVACWKGFLRHLSGAPMVAIAHDWRTSGKFSKLFSVPLYVRETHSPNVQQLIQAGGSQSRDASRLFLRGGR